MLNCRTVIGLIVLVVAERGWGREWQGCYLRLVGFGLRQSGNQLSWILFKEISLYTQFILVTLQQDIFLENSPKKEAFRAHDHDCHK